jgi:hypothetical protein
MYCNRVPKHQKKQSSPCVQVRLVPAPPPAREDATPNERRRHRRREEMPPPPCARRRRHAPPGGRAPRQTSYRHAPPGGPLHLLLQRHESEVLLNELPPRDVLLVWIQEPGAPSLDLVERKMRGTRFHVGADNRRCGGAHPDPAASRQRITAGIGGVLRQRTEATSPAVGGGRCRQGGGRRARSEKGAAPGREREEKVREMRG